MRSTHILKRTGLAAACGVLLFVLGGCPKHENFPTALEITVPPTPSNFNITVPTTPSTDYTFEWEISDPTDVKGYRLYVIGLSPTPELLADETTITSTQIQRSFAYSLTGLQFGVSAVGTGNVESPMTVATAP